jgi:hypothetical protein
VVKLLLEETAADPLHLERTNRVNSIKIAVSKNREDMAEMLLAHSVRLAAHASSGDAASSAEALVAQKTRWLQGTITAFAPMRPRALLKSTRENIVNTLPQSGFADRLDLRAGLDVTFHGSGARGDGMRREWLELVSTEFMDPNVNLFRSRDGGRTFDPSPTGVSRFGATSIKTGQ